VTYQLTIFREDGTHSDPIYSHGDDTATNALSDPDVTRVVLKWVDEASLYGRVAYDAQKAPDDAVWEDLTGNQRAKWGTIGSAAVDLYRQLNP
jgi:hypothetical protein